MTELSPDIQGLLDKSYESDLTEQESEQLLSMCGHGIGPNFSPAAQAVLTAATQQLYSLDPEDVPRSASEHGRAIAAALRAVADQVVPKFWHENNDIYGETMQDVRQNLLAIAAELDGTNRRESD